ncbi:MAG: hypothetical protein ACYS99_01080, partial [Planctomycetota bacterium]
MNDSDSRGLLRTIKVPFDLKAIFIGAVGYLIFIAGGWILDAAFPKVPDGTHVVSRFFDQGLEACAVDLGSIPVIGQEVQGIVHTLYGRPSPELGFWEMLVTGVWFLLVLAIFGGAIARIIAMRIARDESVSAKDALTFSTRNLLSYLLIPVFLGVFIAIFWGCNLFAGLVTSLPVVG